MSAPLSDYELQIQEEELNALFDLFLEYVAANQNNQILAAAREKLLLEATNRLELKFKEELSKAVDSKVANLALNVDYSLVKQFEDTSKLLYESMNKTLTDSLVAIHNSIKRKDDFYGTYSESLVNGVKIANTDEIYAKIEQINTELKVLSKKLDSINIPAKPQDGHSGNVPTDEPNPLKNEEEGLQSEHIDESLDEGPTHPTEKTKVPTRLVAILTLVDNWVRWIGNIPDILISSKLNNWKAFIACALYLWLGAALNERFGVFSSKSIGMSSSQQPSPMPPLSPTKDAPDKNKEPYNAQKRTDDERFWLWTNILKSKINCKVNNINKVVLFSECFSKNDKSNHDKFINYNGANEAEAFLSVKSLFQVSVYVAHGITIPDEKKITGNLDNEAFDEYKKLFCPGVLNQNNSITINDKSDVFAYKNAIKNIFTYKCLPDSAR